MAVQALDARCGPAVAAQHLVQGWAHNASVFYQRPAGDNCVVSGHWSAPQECLHWVAKSTGKGGTV